MTETRERRKLIRARLQQQGDLHVDELAKELGVSPNTIRNDFNALAAAGQLKRVRGGAAAVTVVSAGHQELLSSSFLRRNSIQIEAKEHIARWAAELIVNGDSIILDASTTIFHLARYLQDHRDLTIVTSGVEVARVLAQNRSNTVLLLGGLVRSDGMVVSTLVSEQLLKNLRIGKAFVSCTGFTPEGGLTETNIQEAQLKRQMIAAAESVIALIDASKFGKIGLVPFAPIEQVARIFSNSDLAPSWIESVRQAAGPTILTVCNERGIASFSPGDKEAPCYKIGFANLTERMPFAQEVRRGLEQAVAATKNIELLIRNNDLDHQQALANVDWFIERQVDLVIDYQIDFAAGNVIMDRFRQARIPVIAVDIPLPGASYFGADNYRAGYLAGEGLGHWISEHWQAQFDFLLLLQDPRADMTTGARLQGALDGLESVLGPVSDNHILEIHCPPLMEETHALMRARLANLPATGRIAVIGVNDDIALGALAAFEEAGWLDRVVAVGQNADRLGRAALERADLPFIGSTSYSGERYGERLVELALKTLRGEPVPPATYSAHTFVTKEVAHAVVGRNVPAVDRHAAGQPGAHRDHQLQVGLVAVI